MTSWLRALRGALAWRPASELVLVLDDTSADPPAQEGVVTKGLMSDGIRASNPRLWWWLAQHRPAVVVLRGGEDSGPIVSLVLIGRMLRLDFLIRVESGDVIWTLPQHSFAEEARQRLWFTTYHAAVVLVLAVGLAGAYWLWGLAGVLLSFGCLLAFEVFGVLIATGRGLRSDDMTIARRAVAKDLSPYPLRMLDRELGVKAMPDYAGEVEFTLPLLSQSLRYTITTDADGRRTTRPANAEGATVPAEGRPGLALLGGSHAFGNGVCDEHAFAWRLQEHLPRFEVTNYSVGSHCTASQYFVLRQLFSQDPPRVVVYYFCPSIDEKITGRTKRMVALHSPTCTALLGRDGIEFRTARSYFSSPLAERSHVLRAFEHAVNLVRFGELRRSQEVRPVVEAALLKLRSMCETRGVDFIVAAGGGSSPYWEFLDRVGFAWAPCNRVGDVLMEAHADEYSLFPFDPHPNERAHAHIARVLAKAVREIVAGRIASPEMDFGSGLGTDWAKPPDIPMDIYPLV